MMNLKSTSRILTGLLLTLSLPSWAQTARLTQLVNQAPANETLTASPSSDIAGTNVAFNVNVSGVPGAQPSGSILFTLTPADNSTPTTSTVPLAGGIAVWNQPLPSSNYTVSAVYSGDLNYLSGTTSISGPVATLLPDFDFSLPDVRIKQGSTWNGAVSVTPINGFTGTVTLACSSLPVQMDCTFPAPLDIMHQQGAGIAQVVDLTIKTYPGDFVAASSLFLFTFGFFKRRRIKMLACLGLTSLGLFALAGCGSGGRVVWSSITPKGTYHITVNAVSGRLHHTKQLTVVVE